MQNFVTSRHLKLSQQRTWWRQDWACFVLVSMLVLLLVLSLGIFSPAVADISLTREDQGQMRYQSEQTLQDKQGYSWQVLVSKHAGFAISPTLTLQLVGPHSMVSLDHEQPLTVITSQGKILKALSLPLPMYSGRALAPNVIEYDLKPIVSELNGSIELTMPAERPSAVAMQDEKSIKLRIPTQLVLEWQTVATCADILCTGN